jgi:ATP-dependent Clp protease ATP-binding subunit ClpA
VWLRDARSVSLQMNGTMLRGMFEDRMQNVIREIKERRTWCSSSTRRNTPVGAGSALGAPADAADILTP